MFMKKKGEILVENIVFILLNLVFLAALTFFLLRQGSGAVVLEQSYAKEIAMLVDSAKPNMLIRLDMEKGMKLAEKNGIDFNDVVKIQGNIVRVKLSEQGGYTYSFFNDVDAVPYADDENNEYNGLYVLTIGGKNE